MESRARRAWASILLARLSGRPIFACRDRDEPPQGSRADVGTRRRSACLLAAAQWSSAEPIHVAKDADDAEMERKRQELTETLNATTAKAYALVDGAR